MSAPPSSIDFLAAKINPQRVVGELVKRRGIMAEFRNQQIHPKLSILTAPAGYGKSTLLYQLMCDRQSQGEIVAWLSLDRNDNSLALFSTYLLASFTAVNDSLDEINSSLLMSEAQNANPKEKLTLLFNAIATKDKLVTVILDDFHVINDEKLLRLFDWILESMPSNLSFVVGSRAMPALNVIPDLKAKANLAELDSSALRFSLEDCRSFFAHSVGVQSGFRLDDHLIKLLHDKTEGWVAALQLALLALRSHPVPEEFVKSFSGTNKDVVGYLANCVVSQLDQDTRQFMKRTSILERLNGGLCAALTDNNNAESIIVELERAGMFLFAIDQEGNWYRYHHLFRDYLRAQLLEEDIRLYHRLCQKAGAWFEQSGRIDEAVEYYLNAKDYQRGADLIAESAARVVQYQGQHDTLLMWLRELPESYINGDPKIFVSYLWSLTFMRHFKKIRPTLESFNHSSHQSQIVDNEDPNYLRYNLEMLDCLRSVLSGRQIVARQQSTKWLNSWNKAPQFERGTVLGCLGAACLHTMEYSLARRVLTEASSAFHACEAEYGVAWMDSLYALCCLRQGFVIEAKDVLEKSLLRSNRVMGEYSFSSAMLSLGLGHVYYELNNIEHAGRLTEKGFLYIEEHGLPDITISGYITKARILVSQGDVTSGLNILTSGERFGHEQNIANFELVLLLEHGRLLIDANRLDAAQAIRDDHYDISKNVYFGKLSDYEKVLFELFLVRMNIALGNTEQAVKDVKRLIYKCNQKSCFSALIIGLILRARALMDLDKKLLAMRSLEKAVSLAAPEGWIRVFIDEYTHIHGLLPDLRKGYELKSDGRVPTLEQNLVTSLCEHLPLGQNNDKKSPDQEDFSFDSLTKRETQVLQLLEQGLSNQDLADSLFISLATVKWHLSNIYSKLGVKNKIQAIRVSNQAELGR